MRAGRDIYDGLGGNDVVTLPSEANYNESVGGGQTLGWTDTAASAFYTGSQAGDTYQVNGSDGNYFIQEGAGTETVTITGNGSSTITAGSGNDTVNITGNGANKITIGYGTDNITIAGTGANTISAGTSSAGITITNFSGSITGSAPSPSPGATVTLTGADTGSVTIGSNSTLELQAGSSLNGTITFGSASGGTLKIDGTTMPSVPIEGFAAGDTIELAGVSVASLTGGADTESATSLQISGSFGSDTLSVPETDPTDLIMTASPGGGVALTADGDDEQGAKEAGLVLDAAKTLLNGVTALKQYQGTLTVEEFEESFGPFFGALGATVDAASVYQQFQNDLSAAGNDPTAILSAWDKGYAAALSIGIKAGFKAVISEAAGIAAESATTYGLGVVAGFAADGTIGGYLSALAIGAGVVSAPIVIGRVAAFLAGTAFSIYYDEYSPEINEWIQQYAQKPSILNLQDGYISGATVFADANGTGQLASNDVSTMTDANGNFTLTGGTGPLIAFGGTDTSTGLAFKGQLEAPSGSTVIDPLTTLISGLQQTAGLSPTAAEQEVLAAFGLPSTTDLTTLDPIAGVQSGDTVSAEAYAAGAKAIDTADAIGSAFATASSGFLGAFEAAFASLESDIQTLAAGQILNLTDPATVTALINSVAKTEGVDDASFVSTLSTNIVASNAAVDAKLAQDGASSSLITDVSTEQTAIQSSTFDLTKSVDAIAGGPGNDTIIAASATLTSGDNIDGGGGSNTMALEGPGTFNLALPTTLTNVQTITATEGQAAYSGGGQTYAAQNQIIVLRAGLNATVNVQSDLSLNANNPKPATITIVGAANNDVINLASGNDVVRVGGPGETVNLGSGNNTINVNAATIGATIGNGTGLNTLDVTGGGAVAMGANITDIAQALLSPASTAYHFAANAISGLTISDSSTATADVLTAGGAQQTLTGGGAGKVEFVGAAAGDDTFKDSSALFNGDTISGFGANGDVIDLTDVSSTGLKPLSWSQTTDAYGMLTVSGGVHTAAITLLGQFTANGFHSGPDAGVGTAITYQPAAQALAQTAFQNT